MKVLILGVNGFIGSALTDRIIHTTDWEVYGMDLSTSKLGRSVGHPRFHFVEGDLTIHKEWVEYHVKKCDAVLPLVAIATPARYVKEPLAVFELDFEENLRIVRQCVRYRKRVLFPSTSEVYGMCPDDAISEDESTMVYGPIDKSRWIYASSKQLLDRVIAAYGQTEGLRYTCFRPFNWVGPRLDDVNAAREGSSRVLTQFIVNLLEGEPLLLVDGGTQRRCFTWVGDGIDALMRIIENPGGLCDGEIFNIGAPDNECSIRELAERLAAIHEASRNRIPRFVTPRIETIDSDRYYGRGYQDIRARRPSIAKAQRLLGWSPGTSLQDALVQTFDSFLAECAALEPEPSDRRMPVSHPSSPQAWARS